MDTDPEVPKHADPVPDQDPQQWLNIQDPQQWLNISQKVTILFTYFLPIEHDRHFLRHNEVHIAA
jgi:hypothetical protein